MLFSATETMILESVDPESTVIISLRRQLSLNRGGFDSARDLTLTRYLPLITHESPLKNRGTAIITNTTAIISSPRISVLTLAATMAMPSISQQASAKYLHSLSLFFHTGLTMATFLSKTRLEDKACNPKLLGISCQVVDPYTFAAIERPVSVSCKY